MSIKLGVAPIAWSNDDMPELGGETTLEQCLNEARKAGFTGIESGGKFPKNSDELIPKLNKENLSLCSGWYGAQLLVNTAKDEFSLMKNQLKLFKDCKSPCMVFAEITNSVQGDPNTPLSKRPKLSKDDWNKLVLRINEISKMMMDENMPLAYHHHMGTVVQIEEEIDKLMAMTTNDLGLVFDTGHLIYAGADPLEVYKKYSDRVMHIHCKDVRGEILNHSLETDSSFLNSVLSGVYTVPGDGDFNFSGLFKMVGEANFSGWIVVEAEQDPAKAHPLTYVTMGYKNIKSYCEKYGIQIEERE